ncbi:toprim domain-containing protein [Peptoniphilus rhinitidis]|uniref:toprim domain-containing protein n=1 Tax=Peptoniphilus rhinitidis TaxID=1175452 RepID=UPI0002894819|nr:toprim domain-containing protein [Peptoniphilus rhinitidis]
MGKKYESMSDLSEAQKRNVYYYISNSNSFPDLKTRTEEAGFNWNKKGSTSDRDMRASKSGAISLFKSDISKSGYGFKDYSTGFSALNIIDFQIYLDANGTATNGLKNDNSIREKAVDNLIKDYGLTMNSLLEKVFEKSKQDNRGNFSKLKSKNKRDLIKNKTPEKEIQILGDKKSYNEKNKEFKLNKYRVDPKTKEDIYKLNVMSKKIEIDPKDKNQRIGVLKNYTYDAKKMTPKEPAWQYLKKVRRLSDDTINKYKDSMLSVKLWDGKDGIAFLGTNNGKIYTAEIKNFDKENKRNFKYNKSGDNFAPFEYIKDKNKKLDNLFFVEGAIDAMSLDEVLKNKDNINYGIIGIGGTGNLVKAVEDSLKNLNVDLNDITLAMDNDRAGMDAVKTYIEHFKHIPNLSYPYNMLDNSSYSEAIRLGVAEPDPNNKNEIKIAKDFNDFLVMGRNIRDLINKGVNLSFSGTKKCYINKNYDSITKTKDKHFEKVLDEVSKKTGLTKEEIDNYLLRNNNAGYYKKIIAPKLKKEEKSKDKDLNLNKSLNEKTKLKERVDFKNKNNIEKNTATKQTEKEARPIKKTVKKETTVKTNKEVKDPTPKENKTKNTLKTKPTKEEVKTNSSKTTSHYINKNSLKDGLRMNNEKDEIKKEPPLSREQFKEILDELNSQPIFVLKAKDYKGKEYKSFVSLKDLLQKDVGYNFKANFKPYGLENSESIALLDKLRTGSFLLQARKEDGNSIKDAFMQIDIDIKNKKTNVKNLENPKEFNHSDRYKGFFIEDINELYSDGTLITNNIFSENYKVENRISYDKDVFGYCQNLKDEKTEMQKIQNNDIIDNLKDKNKIFESYPLMISTVDKDKINLEYVQGQTNYIGNNKQHTFKDVKTEKGKGEIQRQGRLYEELDKSFLIQEQRKINQEFQR